MTISENYTTVRKKFKDGHYWSVTYDLDGKKVGQKRWKWPKDYYGNTIVKEGISPNSIKEREIRHDFQQRLAKEAITKPYLKENKLAVPDRIEFSEWAIRFPYEYEIKMIVLNSSGDKEEKFVTVVDEKLLTRKKIEESIRLMLIRYEFQKLKSFRVRRLYLKKGE